MSGTHTDSSISQRVRDLESALEQRGVVTGLEIDAMIDRFLASATPLNGARLVARAWVDPEFRDRLLADGRAGRSG